MKNQSGGNISQRIKKHVVFLFVVKKLEHFIFIFNMHLPTYMVPRELYDYCCDLFRWVMPVT